MGEEHNGASVGEASEHGGHHAHASLFSMGEGDEFDLYHVVLSLCGLLFFTVVFEHGLHTLQHALGAADSPGNQLLQKAKDELMILGFISFCLTVVGEFVDIPHVLLLPFEFAHVLVFMVALCLIAFVPAALRILQTTEHHWDALDAAKPDDIIDKLVANTAPPGSFEREAAHHRVTMHAFCATMNLPPTFDFAVYQRYALTDHLLEMLEVPTGSWVAVAASAVLIHTVSSNTAALGVASTPGYVEFLALGFCLICVVLALRTQMARARASLINALGVEDDMLLLKRLRKLHTEHRAYHKQSTAMEKASYAQARETISTSRRNLAGHSHGGEDHEAKVVEDKHDAAKSPAEGWKKLRAWVNQPLVSLKHVLHLEEEEEDQHAAHFDAHGAFVFDSPGFAFQCCSAALMLTMFYAALLIMRYTRSACHSAATPAEAFVRCALMTIPIPVCTILLSRAIADFSYVACLMHPSSDLLDEALTQTLETREMKTELRERFIRHFQANGGKSIEDVIALFQKYDQDSNGVMDRQEFKEFMEELFGRRVAAKEVEMMFREINMDEELTIDAEEFQGFCFGSGRFGEAGRYMKDVLSPPLTGEEEQTNTNRTKSA